MQLINEFKVPVPPREAWALLLDAHGTVPCFPGATLVGVADDGVVSGRIDIRLGPIAMQFAGKAQFVERDADTLTAAVDGRWTETRGRGEAKTRTRFAVLPEGTESRVEVTTDVTLTGQVAQYGRGVGLIAAMSRQLIDVFATNLRERLAVAGAMAAPSALASTALAPTDAAAAPSWGAMGLRALWAWLLAGLGFGRTPERRRSLSPGGRDE